MTARLRASAILPVLIVVATPPAEASSDLEWLLPTVLGQLDLGGARLNRLVGALAAGAAPNTRVPRRGEVHGRARVVDGDTLEVGGRRVRLHGIDAPESGQQCADGWGKRYDCGARASGLLRHLTEGREVSCAATGRDRYGRIVAVCRAAGRDLGRTLVRHGWAVAYERYSRDYVRDEWEARKERRGLWSGRFDPPEHWRRGGEGFDPVRRSSRREAADPFGRLTDGWARQPNPMRRGKKTRRSSRPRGDGDTPTEVLEVALEKAQVGESVSWRWDTNHGTVGVRREEVDAAGNVCRRLEHRTGGRGTRWTTTHCRDRSGTWRAAAHGGREGQGRGGDQGKPATATGPPTREMRRARGCSAAPAGRSASRT